MTSSKNIKKSPTQPSEKNTPIPSLYHTSHKKSSITPKNPGKSSKTSENLQKSQKIPESPGKSLKIPENPNKPTSAPAEPTASPTPASPKTSKNQQNPAPASVKSTSTPVKPTPVKSSSTGPTPKITFQTADNKSAWDTFVTSHPEANFLQSWDFYEFHRSRGNQVVRRLAIAPDDTIVAAYAGVVEAARRGRHLAIAGGPILDWTDSHLVQAVFQDMRTQGQELGCVFVRVRPQLELSTYAEQIFRSNGFKKAPMYLSVEYAGILNLEKSDEELLAGMRQRLRRALRKAEKNHITVEKSTNPQDIHEFYQIQLQTARRHDFFAFSEDFLTKQFAAFAPHGEAVLYTAKYEGQILAQNFMIFYGNEASYHYGVSSELGTKLSGAPLLHLAAMRDARERGIRRYNFWGIVGEDETNHRFYGVSVFKRGFGVEELKYLPAQDLILKPLAYQKTKLIETARRRRRHV